MWAVSGSSCAIASFIGSGINGNSNTLARAEPVYHIASFIGSGINGNKSGAAPGLTDVVCNRFFYRKWN